MRVLHPDQPRTFAEYLRLMQLADTYRAQARTAPLRERAELVAAAGLFRSQAFAIYALLDAQARLAADALRNVQNDPDQRSE